jgi:hypothetical protein
VNPIGVSENFCFLDLLGSSHGPRDEDRIVTKVDERGAHVMAFNNLGDDSSSDIHEAPLPRVTEEVPPPSPPFMPSEFVHYTFVLLYWNLTFVFYR